YIAPIMTAGRAIARTLNGERTEINIQPSPVLIKTPSYPLALIAPHPQTVASGTWCVETADNRTICRFYDAEGVLTGFGTSPHDNTRRQTLLGELGKKAASACYPRTHGYLFTGGRATNPVQITPRCLYNHGMLSEFDLIARYFKRPTHRSHAALGIGDDCALLTQETGMQLAISTDILVEDRKSVV